MPLLFTEQLSFHFDNGDSLFSNIDCRLTARRTGLVGSNGAGKSVLAALLAGERQPSRGRVHINGSVATYSQLPSALLASEQTLAGYLGVEPVLEALSQVAQGSCDPRWFDIIGDRWQLSEQLSALLIELGLPDDPSLPCRALSGGQLARLQLWKLFQKPVELLILDEPSNHLDRRGKAWLSAQMAQFGGHILLISHDRALLREMEQIWELSSLGLACYGGNYDDYLARQLQEQAAVARQLENVERQQKQLERQAIANRQKAEKRAAQGAASRKQGSQPKMFADFKKGRAGARLSNRNKNEDQRRSMLLQQQQQLSVRQQQVQTQKFYAHPASERRAGLVNALNCKLPFGSGEPLSFSVAPGDKWHLAGCNGSGKSTLLRLIDGQLAPASGEIRINAPVCYLDQHFALLSPAKTLLENLQGQCPSLAHSTARTLLAGIGFRRDEVNRQVSLLSGGEKMKLAMLIVAHQDEQPLLLLDEPDNHLDLASRQLLAMLLADYEGAFVLVSHDEDFVVESGVTGQLTLV